MQYRLKFAQIEGSSLRTKALPDAQHPAHCWWHPRPFVTVTLHVP